MKSTLFFLSALVCFSSSTFALETGKQAPDFSVKSSLGKEVKLSDYKGKTVVLEWLNYGCPFVKKHYKSGNMQKLQQEAKDKGAVWLSVISSAPGKQGHSSPKEAEADKAKNKSVAEAILLDESGDLGRLYGAETTPHMYVIDAKGTLVYQGAIDDKPSTDLEDVKTARNYVREALEATADSGKGKKIELAQTKAYGCSVKYN